MKYTQLLSMVLVLTLPINTLAETNSDDSPIVRHKALGCNELSPNGYYFQNHVIFIQFCKAGAYLLKWTKLTISDENGDTLFHKKYRGKLGDTWEEKAHFFILSRASLKTLLDENYKEQILKFRVQYRIGAGDKKSCRFPVLVPAAKDTTLDSSTSVSLKIGGTSLNNNRCQIKSIRSNY